MSACRTIGTGSVLATIFTVSGAVSIYLARAAISGKRAGYAGGVQDQSHSCQKQDQCHYWKFIHHLSSVLSKPSPYVADRIRWFYLNSLCDIGNLSIGSSIKSDLKKLREQICSRNHYLFITRLISSLLLQQAPERPSADTAGP